MRQCLVARVGADIRRFELPQTPATIGRSRRNDLVLPFSGVSGEHALLTPTNAGLLFTDAGSTNGIVHEGARVSEALLTPGRTIRLGPAVLSIEEADSDELRVGLAAARSDDTGETEAAARRATETDAIAFITRIQRGEHDVQDIVTTARELLRASSVSILLDLAYEALAGAVPDEPLLATLVTRAREDRGLEEDIRRVGGQTVMATARVRRAQVALFLALFDGPPRAIAPWEKSLFGFLAAKLLDVRQRDERPAAVSVPPSPANMVVESPAMRETIARARSFAELRRPILLRGETGTGKELLAQLLHETGPFASGKYWSLNCAALSKDLLEAELFGIEKDVATGVGARRGRFVEANGGTLFLDEIGEIPHAVQATLLRVVEYGEVWPVGARAAQKVSLRIVFATHRDVGPEGTVATVRPDLAYRCTTLSVPPLRARREDVVPLATRFLQRNGGASLSVKAVRVLLDHPWPGNVRELEHTIEEAVLRFGRGGVLQSEHLAAVLRETPLPAAPKALTLRQERDAGDRLRVEAALRECGGNRSEAAKKLGMSRNGLRKMTERLWIE